MVGMHGTYLLKPQIMLKTHVFFLKMAHCPPIEPPIGAPIVPVSALVEPTGAPVDNEKSRRMGDIDGE